VAQRARLRSSTWPMTSTPPQGRSPT
jgi:hypothetical protein